MTTNKIRQDSRGQNIKSKNQSPSGYETERK